MKRIKIGINGFGRIGRAFTRIALTRNTFDIVAVNTRSTDPQMLAYLLKYDSVYRTHEASITTQESSLTVGENTIHTTKIPDPSAIPWDQYGVDIVVDATGAFTTKADLKKHIRGSVQKVILTAPSKDEETDHVVLGVNDEKIDFRTCNIISNCSCTTNCASPVIKIVDEAFGISSGFLTTVHAYTISQSMLDDANKKFDRSRAAPLNIVPTTTGAAKAVVKTLPHLANKLDGMAIRVPVPTGSFTDFSLIVEKQTTSEEINRVFEQASQDRMKGILGYAQDVIVSSDIIGSPYSSIFDPHYTKVVNGNLVKVYSWYDNEWGYSTRLVDLVERYAQAMQ